MTRYEECLSHLKRYVADLRSAPGLRPDAIEGLTRAHVEQAAYDITFRDKLVHDALEA